MKRTFQKSFIGITSGLVFGWGFRKSLNSTHCDDSPLTRNFVADAVDISNPSVVNILCRMRLGISSGSGFIISKDGFVVTNAHVVDKGDKNIQVTLWDQRKFHGVVHSIDRQSDIALVKLQNVEYENLPIAKMGTSSKLRAGEFVIALGSPMNLPNSVTLGIVSSASRYGSEMGIASMKHIRRNQYIQTDAAINVGNSGGPLVNLDGEVVGINTMKYNNTQGISFSISIDSALEVIQQLRSNQRVIRPYLGLKLSNPTTMTLGGGFIERRAESDSWVQIAGVADDSPAFKAGLRRGDFIVEVDEKEVHSTRDVFDAIGFTVGRMIKFGVRDQSGNSRTVTVTSVPENR